MDACPQFCWTSEDCGPILEIVPYICVHTFVCVYIHACMHMLLLILETENYITYLEEILEF